MDNSINEILKMSNKAKKDAKKYSKKRFIYKEIFEKKGKAFVGIAGLRGTGKTVLLKQKLLETQNAVYFSLDTTESLNLYETAEYLENNYGTKILLFDEISYYKNWQKEIKKIYDFLNVKVFFTSSVAIDIIHSKYDLGRRVIIKNLFPFSFREFLFFSKKISEKQLTLKDINKKSVLQKISQYSYLFEEYIRGGLMPSFLDERDFSTISNILERIIERDLVYSLNFSGEDISNIKLMLEFIANASIDGISYSSISKNIGITKYKATQYVNALEKAFILNVLKPKGTNVLREPKILFVPPFRLKYSKNKEIKEIIGALREEFFVENMKMNSLKIHYLKGKRGEKTPDYFLREKNKDYVFEIGGKSKTRTQLTRFYSVKNKFILTQPPNITETYKPLIFTGFLK